MYLLLRLRMEKLIVLETVDRTFIVVIKENKRIRGWIFRK